MDNKITKINTKLRDAYDRHIKIAERLEHIGWYGTPVKRPPPNIYRENFDKIKWNKI